MSLRIKKAKAVFSDDLDSLVQETYGRPYCFQQQDDCRRRDTWVSLEVPCTWEDDYEATVRTALALYDMRLE